MLLASSFTLVADVPAKADFLDIGGVLVAHVWISETLQPPQPFNKVEIGFTLKGWPPFYRASITFSDGTTLRNCLQSQEDVARAGWIVFVGSSTRPLPLMCHNMKRLPGHAMDLLPYQNTTMKLAVNRLKHTLENIPSRLAWR